MARIGKGPKILVLASLLAIVVAFVLGGLMIPRTVIIEPTQVLTTVEKTTTVQKIVGNYTFSNNVGGIDGTQGWGISLGSRKPSEIVAVEISSVYEVFVCLARMEKIELDLGYLIKGLEHGLLSAVDIFMIFALLKSESVPAGLPLPIESADCENQHLLKTGRVSFEIPSWENYTLVIGKAAGYLSSSFDLDITVSEMEEVMVTETITMTVMTTRTL